ncbi:MAG TPA: hypothetical protein VFV66_09640, partial [Nonomuraea sp.]|nr:hypothetical protein [Nonomuraea sp.]
MTRAEPDAAGEPEEVAVEETVPEQSAEQLLYVDQLLRVTCALRPGPSVVRVVGEVDRSNSMELLR